MEHLPDDPVAIPGLVNSLGLGSEAISGRCLPDPERTSVRPDTLYFVPRPQ
jgi:hypothetical protein